MTLLPQLICAHLVGDFLLQNDWMARNKSKYMLVCFAHVCCYSLPFLLLLKQLPLGSLIAILSEHMLQDWFELHLVWMKWFRQSTPDKWPTGPLCVDQAMHIAYIWFICMVPP